MEEIIYVFPQSSHNLLLPTIEKYISQTLRSGDSPFSNPLLISLHCISAERCCTRFDELQHMVKNS